MSTKISIVNVKNYDSILDATKAGIRLIADSLPFDIRECKNILLKPNLLRPTKDACTQPVFVRAVLEYLKDVGVENDNISVGDSPCQIKSSAQTIAKKIGVPKLLKKRLDQHKKAHSIYLWCFGAVSIGCSSSHAGNQWRCLSYIF